MNKKLNRRRFIAKAGAASVAGLVINAAPAIASFGNSKRLAISGGTAVRSAAKEWPKWPYLDDKMLNSINDTVKSRNWCRIDSPTTSKVKLFENEYPAYHGAKYAVATGSGTQALSTVVHALKIEAGDEIITSPYTDMGTIAGVLTSRALPVMADIDPSSYQLNPDDVERKITPRTKALMPVHMMGSPADLRRIMEIAKKHKLLVIEDACQAHLAKFDGKLLGNFGDAGCFSFQSTKVIACGEGGAVITNNEELADRCYSVQNHGTDKKGKNICIGPKYRMNELQAALVTSQMESHKERHVTRNKNARYLTEKLKGFKGVIPQKLYPGTEECSFYLYTMSFKKEHWGGVTRDQFIKAINAEGVPINGYLPVGLHKHDWIDYINSLNVYNTMYGKKRMDAYTKDARNKPFCDQVCSEMLLLPGSGPLLGSQKDMDDIITAIMKLYDNRDKLKSI